MATIAKRMLKDGSPSYRAEIRLKREGKIVFREAKSFSKEQAAVRWAKRRETELEDPEVLRRAIAGKNAVVTVADLIARYVKEVYPLKKWGRTKQMTLDALLNHDIVKKDALSLSARDIVEHCKIRVTRHGVTPSTANQDFIYLKQIFAVADHLLGVPVSVAPFVEAQPTLSKLRLIGKSNERVRRPGVDELTDIVSLAYERRHGPYHVTHDYAPIDKIIVFAMFSGRRLEEICNIRWDDVDEVNQTVLVRNMKHPREKVGNHIACYVPNEAWAVLHSMPRIEGEPRIFPYHHRSVGTRFQRLRAEAGHEHREKSENLKFHDLRHECVSWLLEKNGYNGEVWDIPRVAKTSGHQSWSALQIYEDIISVEPCDRWEKWEWKTKVVV